MKQFATIVAFSVTSLVGLGKPSATTPLEVIPNAEKVELYFGTETSLDYLLEVRNALAQRDISLEFNDITFDEAGKLVQLSFSIKQGDVVSVSTTAEITEQAGAYIFLA